MHGEKQGQSRLVPGGLDHHLRESDMTAVAPFFSKSAQLPAAHARSRVEYNYQFSTDKKHRDTGSPVLLDASSSALNSDISSSPVIREALFA